MIRVQFLLLLIISTAALLPTSLAQTPPQAASAGSLLHRALTPIDSNTGAWTAEQIGTMSRLRDAALGDDYAYRQLAYLTDTIGPRLAGSLQAGAAVKRIADQMRALGAVVTLEKTTVPHWVR